MSRRKQARPIKLGDNEENGTTTAATPSILDTEADPAKKSRDDDEYSSSSQETSSLEENNNSYKESLTNSINGLLANLVHWTSSDAVQSTKATLESLATRAETNPSIGELTLLQQTLFTLQQQQLLQMHLFDENNADADVDMEEEAKEEVIPEAKEQGSGLSPKFTSLLNFPDVDPNRPLSPGLSGVGERGINSLDLLTKRAEEVLDSASQGLLQSSLVDDRVKKSASGSREPFFKHRCRYCGKVFGSDSALQIHIRSHTGERPFKCNVCGSRFTTKGNLKVHFQRHSSKFPHVKMNPHPIPEHLDSLHPPLLSEGEASPEPQPPQQHCFPAFGQNIWRLVGVAERIERPEDLTKKARIEGRNGEEIKLERSLHPNLNPNPIPLTVKEANNVNERNHSVGPDERPESLPEVKIKTEYPSDEEQDERQNGVMEEMAEKKEPSEDLRNSNHLMDDSDNMSSDSEMENKAGDKDDYWSDESDGPENLSSKSLPLLPVVKPRPTRPSSLTSYTNPHHQHPPPRDRTQDSSDGEQFPNSALHPSMYNQLLPRPGSNDNAWESLIEVTKTSETAKLQMLVDNIEHKLTDPNQCIICHRVLSCKSALQMHYRTHTGERPFKCKICGRAFTTKGNLKTHMGVHRIKPALRVLHQCPVCHKRFTNSLVLQQHIRLHTGEPTDLTIDQIRAAEVRDYPHHPPFLPPTFPPPAFLHQQPPLLKDGISPFSTSLAALENQVRTINNSHNPHSHLLLQHESQLSHEPPESVTSDDASEDRKSDSPFGPLDLTSTNTNTNSTTSSNNRVFNFSPASLTTTSFNIRDMLPVPPPWPVSPRGNTTCNICLKTFACHSALEIHYRSHTKERPFKCSTCDRGFSTKGNMRQHQLTHKIREISDDSSGVEKRSVSGDNEDSKSGLSGLDTPLALVTKPESNSSPMSSITPSPGTRPRSSSGSPIRPSAERSISQSPIKMDERARSPSKMFEMPRPSAPIEIPNCRPAFKTDDRPHSRSSHKADERPHSRSSYKADDRPQSRSTYKPEDRSQSMSAFKSDDRPQSRSSPRDDRNKSSPDPKHLCKVCRKTFSSSSSVHIHMRTHTGDKPFKCSVCGKAFTTKGNLKVHMGTHMWTGGVSRRGRRMSLELALPPTIKDHMNVNHLGRPDLFFPFLPNSVLKPPPPGDSEPSTTNIS